MSGLTSPEGNHGEDVKEYWWYADATPTASWLSWVYHYPQAEFPYAQLREENARRSRKKREFELADTGVFDDGRWWRIAVDYAKAAPLDLCVRIRIRNAGPEAATLERPPDALVAEPLVLGPGRGAAGHRRGDARARRRSAGDRHGRTGRDLASRDRARPGRPSAGPAVLRKRGQRPAPLRRQGPDALPEGRDQRRRRLGRRDRQPRAAGHKNGGALSPHGRGGRRGRVAAPAQARRR